MLKIVADDKIPFLRGVFEPFAQVLYLPGGEIDAEAVKDADALVVRTRTICDASLLEGSAVRVIASATIGTDHIDTAWCSSRGVAWRNAPGCNSGSVMQYITAVLLFLSQKRGLDLSRLTLGVVGCGNVGSKVAAAAGALGMRVLINDPPLGQEDFVSLDTLIERSDIISLHVPLEKEGPHATWHLFDGDRLASMRPGQILINSSRGPVVDNSALKEMLRQGRIGGACLDVWEDEPKPDWDLLDMLDIATPHIAGYSADGKANGTAAAVRAVAEVLDLPLKSWAVPAVPAPVQPLLFTLDASGRSVRDVLSEAVLHTYDILADDRDLRTNPEAFELLRGNYAVRREFGAYTIKLKGGTPETARRLEKLGFKLENQ